MINREKLEKMLCKELDKIENEITNRGGMTEGMLNSLHKITDTIKNLYKIEALSNDGYSGMRRPRDDWRYYDDGSSYDDDYSGRRHYVRGHYSRDDAKNSMIERLENLMHNANTEKDRETIRETISTLKNM